jgi:hypothetical protein
MKAVGMLLILIGHIIGDPENIYNLLAQPTFTKQIGVAFFVFITGWGLANETRDSLRVVFNRLFPFYFYGVVFALIISLLFLVFKGDINESNYLPFILGVNVLFNNFPANPTTWYIGTYIHMLLFWYFFFAGKAVRPRHIVIAFLVENLIRTIILYWGRDFTAYMILPNWISVFLLGMYLHDRKQVTAPLTGATYLVMLGIIVTAWTMIANTMGFDGSFPFRNLPYDQIWRFPLESLLTSVTYILYTLLFFEAARRLPGNRVIVIFAEATLITVIVHMPIIYETHKVFYSFFADPMTARIVYIIVIYIGLAFFSMMLNRMINLKILRERLWHFFEMHILKFIPIRTR